MTKLGTYSDLNTGKHVLERQIAWWAIPNARMDWGTICLNSHSKKCIQIYIVRVDNFDVRDSVDNSLIPNTIPDLKSASNSADFSLHAHVKMIALR